MKILGIESATDVCAAAVADGGRIRSERLLDARARHSEKLVLLIDEVLGNAGLRLTGLDGIAVSIGPGSFTGLRIGLSVAKGLAYAAGLPLAAVPTLEALAMQAVRLTAAAEGECVAPMVDARRSEVYAALYEVRGGRCRLLMDPVDGDAASFEDRITGERRTAVCGDGAEKFLRTSGPRPGLIDAGNIRCSAAAVALLGEERLAAGTCADLASLEPFYVKEFSSTTHF